MYCDYTFKAILSKPIITPTYASLLTFVFREAYKGFGVQSMIILALEWKHGSAICIYIYKHTHTHKYIYIYIYMCLCVCVSIMLDLISRSIKIRHHYVAFWLDSIYADYSSFYSVQYVIWYFTCFIIYVTREAVYANGLSDGETFVFKFDLNMASFRHVRSLTWKGT